MKKVTLLFASIFLCTISCSDKEPSVFLEPVNDISTESNSQVLKDGVDFGASGVLEIFKKNTIDEKTSKADEQAGDYPLTLVAKINPPSYNGRENLTASHVAVEGNYAYVAYNTVNDNYAGAIDIINVNNPNKPQITSRLYYTNADVNSVKYENGHIYAVGGVNSKLSARATSNSFVAKISVINGKFDLNDITYGFQIGSSATDVTITTNRILVTSGKDGTLTSYDKTNVTIVKEVPFPDLRAISTQDNKIAILEASIGVLILDKNYNTTKEIAVNNDFGIATKSTLCFSGENIIVTEGVKGAGVYNTITGNFIEYVPILINPNDVDSQDIVTNAVATNNDVLLMANGGAGLCIAEDKGNNPDLVGIVALEGSINYVASKGDYIFAASGKKGLQIIKFNKPSESLIQKCKTLNEYNGSANLNIYTNQSRAYKGNKRFNGLTVAGELFLCGIWTSINDASIGKNAFFEINGIFYIGNNKRKKNVIVSDGGTLKIEGDLIIYGDLVLNEGATVEFLGENSRVYISGSINKLGNVSIKGKFEDLNNKF